MEITPLPSTQKGPEQWFTGDVCFDVLGAPPEPARPRVNAVRSAPDRFMTHLARWEIGDASTGPDTEWAEEGTDEQYEGARA